MQSRTCRASSCSLLLIYLLILFASSTPGSAGELPHPELWSQAFPGMEWTHGRLSVEIPAPSGAMEASERPLALARLAVALQDDHETAATPATAHARGLFYLLAAGPARAVPLLEEAARGEGAPAEFWSDLSVAYAARGEETQQPFDLILALEAVHEAVSLAPTSPVVVYNLASSLERLHLVRSAGREWERFLELAPTDGAQIEVRERLDRLREPRVMEEWEGEVKEKVLEAADARDLERLRPLVRQFAPSVRSLIERDLILTWAESIVADDASAAERSLRSARSLALILEAETGEGLPAASISMIDNAVSLSDRKHLAVSYALFKNGWGRLMGDEYAAARELFDEATKKLGEAGSPFSAWSHWYASVCHYYEADLQAAREDYERLRQRPALVRSPILLARTERMLGLLAITMGHPGEAIAHYERGMKAVTSESFREEVEGFFSLLAEAYQVLGDAEKEWHFRLASLESTQRASSDTRVHLALQGVVSSLLAQGRPIAAGYFVEEIVRNTESSEDVLARAETYFLQAQVLGMIGERQASLESLALAEQQIVEVPEEKLRERLWAYKAITQAEHDTTLEALERLAEAESYYESSDDRFWLPRLRLIKARRHRFAGRAAQAEQDLVQALRDLEQIGSSAPPGWLRLMFFETAQQTFDEFVDLFWEQERYDRSFEIAERGRAQDLLHFMLRQSPFGVATRRVAESAEKSITIKDVQAGLPKNVSLIFFAERPEGQLAAWRFWADDFQARALGTFPRLADRIGALRDKLAARESVEQVQDELGDLYDTLMKPLVAGLPADTTLVIVPDRSLASAPFSAFYDRTTQRYLIEQHPVIVAPSATLFIQASERAKSQRRLEKRTALIVSDPELSPLFPDLTPLPYAREEAKALAALYPTSEPMVHSAAAKARVKQAITRYSVVHFSTHALTKVGSPLQSMLVLAAGEEDDGLLYAHEIEELAFEVTELVVLASCRSRGEETGWRDFLVGLPRAFLAAGVPAVVATLWPVDDEESVALAKELHMHLARGENPAVSLQQAQVALLRTEKGDLSTWPAYTLVGGTVVGSEPIKNGGKSHALGP